MPKYRFVCPGCNFEREKYTSPSTETVPCHYCEGQEMRRQFPGSGSQQVREVVDSYSNVRQTPDATAENKARKTEYFWEIEVPRLIQTYSLETCLQEGWLVYNDKNELVINKPPSKR
jgi:hypothetical protein